MSTSISIVADNRRIEQQHADLGRLIAEISRNLDRGATAEAIAPRLEKLRGSLAEHFASEEAAEGFYDQIAEVDPRFAQRIADLRDEHAVLLMLADEAIAAGEIGKIREVFTRLREILGRHEHDENNLLQVAYNEDIGSKD